MLNIFSPCQQESRPLFTYDPMCQDNLLSLAMLAIKIKLGRNTDLDDVASDIALKRKKIAKNVLS